MTCDNFLNRRPINRIMFEEIFNCCLKNIVSDFLLSTITGTQRPLLLFKQRILEIIRVVFFFGHFVGQRYIDLEEYQAFITNALAQCLKDCYYSISGSFTRLQSTKFCVVIISYGLQIKVKEKFVKICKTVTDFFLGANEAFQKKFQCSMILARNLLHQNLRSR